MGMKDEYLSQDIMPDDILGIEGEADVGGQSDDMTDILSDMPVEEVAEVADETLAPTDESTPEAEGETETQTETETEIESTEGDLELDGLLKSIADISDDAQADAAEASEGVASAAEKLESLEAGTENPETLKVLEEVYQELIKTDSSLQELQIRSEAKDALIKELQTTIANNEIEAYGNTTSSDPDVMILNKMYDAATTGSETARNKIRDVMDNLYVKLFDETYEDSKVKKNIEDSADINPAFNEGTLAPEPIPEAQPEFDPDSPTAILGY